MISEETIQAVRDLPIEDVIGQYTKLKKNGPRLMGECPFHSERTPSFSVSPEKGLYYCFSCQRGGNGIAFIREKENLSFIDAVKFLAERHNITIKYTKSEKSAEEIEAAKARESLFVATEAVHKFFVEQFRSDTSDEAKAAREYAYSRWPQKFCNTTQIGYAPKNAKVFSEYCKAHCISTDILMTLGLMVQGQYGPYPLFRDRIVIPIKNRTGRVIAFTARALDNEVKPKYINNPNSQIFNKGMSLFGIDKSAKCSGAPFFYIVEGAPDVLRLQSLGINNVVATLGTAWSDTQFEMLKKVTPSVCFIPDSDPAPEDKSSPFGPGFNSVMKNGAEAMRQGFDVTVRELPFAIGDDGKPAKNDADSHIREPEDITALPEKPFVVWLTEKKFKLLNSQAEKRQFIAEIAELMLHISDSAILDDCYEQLSEIHGKPKLWREAVSTAKGAAKQKATSIADTASTKDDRQREVDLLSRYNLFIRNNCYYSNNDDNEPLRLSNFILEPLYHIMDESNGTRIFRIVNTFGHSANIEFRESELCSVSTFQQRVGSLGNFIWRVKIDKLNNVKEYIYAKTDSAERIRKLGWDPANEFYSFGNGIFSGGEFYAVDELGIVKPQKGRAFYIPALSKMYIHNPELYQYERLMVHENRSSMRLYDYANSLCQAYGDNARIAVCYVLATLFRDIIYRRTSHFPILNLFGEKGTGKTTLALCLQSLFMRLIDPPNLGTATIPAMNDRASQSVNSLAVFDEYKNDLDPRKIAYLKGLWGGSGQMKKNAAADGMAAQTVITNGIALCGQDKPTQDMALFTRLLYLSFTKTSFTPTERQRFDDFYTQCKMGLTHLTLQILSHRKLFEKNFASAYTLTKSELGAKMADEEVHDRIFGNWIIPLATFRVLETVLDLPFSYSELFDTAIECLRHQNEFSKDSSEVAGFWSTIQGYQTAGRCIDKAHFRIKYVNRFQPIGLTEAMEFAESRPILYLNGPAIENLVGGRGANVTANRSNWSTTLSYLKAHKSYLGLKQDRFMVLTPQGSPDFTFEMENGVQVRKNKCTRPKALCFDYLALKEAYGLDLETAVLSDAEELGEDYQETHPAPVPDNPTRPQPRLFEEDTPF